MRKHHQKQLRVRTRASKTTFQFPYWLNTQLTQYLICKNKPSKLPYWQTHNPPSAYLILHYAPTKMCAHCPCTRSVHIMCMYMLRTLYLKGRLQQLLGQLSVAKSKGPHMKRFFLSFTNPVQGTSQLRKGGERTGQLLYAGWGNGRGLVIRPHPVPQEHTRNTLCSEHSDRTWTQENKRVWMCVYTGNRVYIHIIIICIHDCICNLFP
jgi:hypothetical protein